MGDTVTIEDASGNEVEVEAGVDGKNPVSVNNPPAKAVLGKAPAYEDKPPTDNAAPSAEEQKEMAAAADAAVDAGDTGDTRPEDSDEDSAVPSGNASKEDWVAYGKTQPNWDVNDEGLHRDELRAKYGK